MSKKCSSCGFSKNPDNANYCGNCGCNLDYYYNWRLYDYAHQTAVPDYKLSEYKRYEEKVKSSIFYNFSGWCANLWNKLKDWWREDGIVILLSFVCVVIPFCFILFVGKSCNRDEQSSRQSATSAQITKGELNFNGAKYVGEYKNGQPHGKGVMTYDNGSRYEGDWEDGQRNGKGVGYYPNGDKYDGDWENGQRNGKGVCYYANGNKYDGDWENDQRNSKGVFYFANGDKYDGEWKNGQINGKGVFYYANGDKYDGDLENGQRNGKGVYYYATGDKHDGEWKNGQRNGKGVYYYANGSKFEGEWENGKWKNYKRVN